VATVEKLGMAGGTVLNMHLRAAQEPAVIGTSATSATSATQTGPKKGTVLFNLTSSFHDASLAFGADGEAISVVYDLETHGFDCIQHPILSVAAILLPLAHSGAVRTALAQSTLTADTNP